MNKKIKTILAVSIAFNIVFASFFLGNIFKKHKPGNFMKYKEKQIISVLPKEKQILAKEVFEKLEKIRNENFENSKSDLAEIEKIVTDQNFDQKLFLEKMKGFHELHEKEKAICNREIATFLENLNQDERKKVVEQFKKSMKGFRR